jgi:cell division protein FtsW
VLGLAPLTGVPLPFISYGATNLCILLAGMGILLNIAAGGSARLRVVPEPGTRARRPGGGGGGGPGGARAPAGGISGSRATPWPRPERPWCPPRRP